MGGILVDELVTTHNQHFPLAKPSFFSTAVDKRNLNRSESLAGASPQNLQSENR
jgi:hypothetical protein